MMEGVELFENQRGSEIDIFYVLGFIDFILENPEILGAGNLNLEESKAFDAMKSALRKIKANDQTKDLLGSSLRNNITGWGHLLPLEKYLKINQDSCALSRFSVLVSNFVSRLDCVFDLGDIIKESDGPTIKFDVFQFINNTVLEHSAKIFTRVAASTLLRGLVATSSQVREIIEYDSKTGCITLPGGLLFISDRDVRNYKKTFEADQNSGNLTGLYCYYEWFRQGGHRRGELPEKLKMTDFDSEIKLEAFSQLANTSTDFNFFKERLKQHSLLSTCPIVKRSLLQKLSSTTVEEMSSSFDMDPEKFYEVYGSLIGKDLSEVKSAPLAPEDSDVEHVSEFFSNLFGNLFGILDKPQISMEQDPLAAIKQIQISSDVERAIHQFKEEKDFLCEKVKEIFSRMDKNTRKMKKNIRSKASYNTGSSCFLEEAVQYIKEAEVGQHGALNNLLSKKLKSCNPMNRLLSVKVNMDSRSILDQIKQICLNIQDTPDKDQPSSKRLRKTRK